MELHDFLTKTRIPKFKFAKMIRVSKSALYKYINKEREPSLPVAMSIVEASGGMVEYGDLLMKRRKRCKSLHEVGEYADRQVKYANFEDVDGDEWNRDDDDDEEDDL